MGGALGRRVQRGLPDIPTEEQVAEWDEFNALVDHFTNGFSWEVGRYDGKVVVHTQELKDPVERTFSFEINANGLAHVRANIATARRQILAMARFDETQSKVVWAWLYPVVRS